MPSTAPSSLPTPRVDLITDAVIIAYIHSISQRHREARPVVSE